MQTNLVETNVYRVLKMCPNCPFRDNGKAIALNDGRVDSIKDYLLESDQHSFTCHKTAYNLDLDMKPLKTHKQPLKMCAGAYEFLKEQKRPNIMMRLAVLMGYEK